MNNQTLGLIIGGILPAICFGLDNFLSKLSMQEGIGTGMFFVIIGLSVTCIGSLLCLFQTDHAFSLSSGIAAASKGIVWTLGTIAVTFALTKFNIPLSKIAPLQTCSVLVAVALSMIVFSEWKEVEPGKLLFGTLMITFGAILVSKS